MGLLAKGGGGMDDEFKGVTLSGEPLVCPDCRLEVAPWIGECPECGLEVVTASEAPPQEPEIPAHLLDGLDDVGAEPASPDAVDPDGDDQDTDGVEWPE